MDATGLDHRIFQVRQRLSVQPGPLKLYFPRWLPGTHSPGGDVSRLAGLVIKAAGQPLAWTRDPLDTHAFLLTVAPGVRELDLAFAHLSPVAPDSGRVVATRQMLNLQWHNLLLYLAGPAASGIKVQASLRLPEGWSFGTALRPLRSERALTRFAPVSVEQLVDSPVFAGQHVKRFALGPEGAAQPVVLHLTADSAAALATTEAQIDAHRRLVQQADKLFGARRFAHYDFLLALSDELGGIGLEHHQSSENGVDLKYFEAWDKAVADRELRPHEYTHAWNGKFRRPADLATFDDVVSALKAVLPHDWADFLRQRLDGHGPGAPLDGLARAGWRRA